MLPPLEFDGIASYSLNSLAAGINGFLRADGWRTHLEAAPAIYFDRTHQDTSPVAAMEVPLAALGLQSVTVLDEVGDVKSLIRADQTPGIWIVHVPLNDVLPEDAKRSIGFLILSDADFRKRFHESAKLLARARVGSGGLPFDPAMLFEEKMSFASSLFMTGKDSRPFMDARRHGTPVVR